MRDAAELMLSPVIACQRGVTHCCHLSADVTVVSRIAVTCQQMVSGDILTPSSTARACIRSLLTSVCLSVCLCVSPTGLRCCPPAGAAGPGAAERATRHPPAHCTDADADLTLCVSLIVVLYIRALWAKGLAL